jgi:hypothetical protein
MMRCDDIIDDMMNIQQHILIKIKDDINCSGGVCINIMMVV